MSRTLVFSVLCIASAGLVSGLDDDSSCESLNFIKTKTHLLGPHPFVEKLETCKDVSELNANLTSGALVLLEVYKAIDRKQECTFPPKMEQKLIDCVTSETGTSAALFNAKTAKEHFALNSTEAILFNGDKCTVAGKVLQCIEDEFSAKKVSRELKGCKDNILRGFNVTSELCKQVLVRLDRNSGRTNLPSYTITLATVVMLAKLAVFSRF